MSFLKKTVAEFEINRPKKIPWELIFLAVIFVFAFFIRFDSLPWGSMWWDSGRYGSIGMDLMNHPLDYSTDFIEGGKSIDLYMPLLPYLLMISQFIFGSGSEFAVRIVNVFLGALSVVIIYFLGKWLFNWRVGIIAAGLLSVSPTWFFFNSRILLETPLVFFMILAMALFWRGFEQEKTKSAIASGACTASAYLSRVSGILLIPIQALYLLVTHGFKVIKDKKVWLFLIAAVLVASPWFIRNFLLCGNISCGALQSGVSVVSGTHAGAAFDFFLFDWIAQYPNFLTAGVAIFFVIGLLFVLSSIGQQKRGARAEILLLLWWLVLMAFLSQQWGKGSSEYRHLLFVLPPLILFAAVGIDKISNLFAQIKFAPIVVILVILMPLMFFSYSQGHATVIAGQHSFNGLDSVGRYISENYPEESKFLVGSPNQIYFYSGGGYNISHMWWMLKENQSLSSFLKEHNFEAIIVDGFEQLQPGFVFDHTYMNSLPYLEWESAFYHQNKPVAILYKIKKGTLARVID